MGARLWRAALRGLVIGLVLVAMVEWTPEGGELPVAIGGVVVLVVGMRLWRRWLGRRKDQEKDEKESQ